MTDHDLTPDDLKTLARFQSPAQPTDIDPQVFAKLLSMALIEQKEGGPELTVSGLERVNNLRGIAQGRRSSDTRSEA